MSNKSLDGVLTKKAHTREKFSEEQIQDLVECSNSKTGFEYFVHLLYDPAQQEMPTSNRGLHITHTYNNQ